MIGRAVSPVIGVVLLLGLTSVVALSMLLLGATMLSDSHADANRQQAERSLATLAQSADRIASGEVHESSFEVRGSEDAQRTIDGDAGRYEVRIERENGTEVLTTGDLGAYRYVHDDGTTLAFQGGGVWRKAPGSEARMVTAPEFHYRAFPDPTLTLPIVRIDERNRTVGREATLSLDERRDVYPAGPRHANPLREGVVYLAVESEYCTGWEAFFRSRTDGAIAEGCVDAGETARGEVLVELSVPLRLNGLEHGVWTANDNIHKKASVEKIKADEYDANSVDVFVEHRHEECEERGYEQLNGTIDEAGLHCTESITDNLVVDTDAAGGDVEIFARGGMADNNDVAVRGTDGTVSVFFGGLVEYGGGSNDTTIGDASDPTRTRLYFNSSASFEQYGDGSIYALVYAPRSRFYVHASGSGTFEGAIVAETVEIGSASVQTKYDPGFEDVEIVEEGAGEPFYYLHVSETTLSIDD